MPFTPFHFGPGILVKSAISERFSLVTFLVSQVIIDFETLINILKGAPRLHTFFHSYLGATAAAVITCLVVKISYRLNSRIGIIKNFTSCSLTVILISALIGGWSHVALDSIMHSDLQPYWPFSLENHLLRIIPLRELHLGCTLSGLIGMMIWLKQKSLSHAGVDAH